MADAASDAASDPGSDAASDPGSDPGSGAPQHVWPPLLLGVASNFSQGRQDRMLEAAFALPTTRFRDGMLWRAVEERPGRFDTSGPMAAYPAQLAARGGELTLTVAGAHPRYDAGGTPHSPEGVAAIARFAAEMVRRFPAITAVEVGNEFNSQDFVRGRVLEEGLRARAGYHLALLRAIGEEVRAVRPEVKILGGAAHSIPAGYLWSILDKGGAELMDALVLHPYTTPIEQLRAQIGVLRRHPAARTMPIAVTEFGSNDKVRAPDDLVRGFAMLATLGVIALDWYPLNDRGDGMAPLLTSGGAPTPAGEAFRFVQRRLAGRPARDVSPDPFTYAIAFGDRALVIWGEPRSLTLGRADIALFDSRGRPLASREATLAPDRPLILLAEAPFALGDPVQAGCSPLLADTYHQFAYPPENGPPDSSPADSSPAGAIPALRPALVLGQRTLEWQMLPGQQQGGVPWVPYLGHAQRGGLRLTAERVMLPGVGDGGAQAQWRYASGAARNLVLEVALDMPRDQAAGWELAVSSGDEVVFAQRIAGTRQFDVPVASGPRRDVVVTLAQIGTGDPASLGVRLRLRDPARCGA